MKFFYVAFPDDDHIKVICTDDSERNPSTLAVVPVHYHVCKACVEAGRVDPKIAKAALEAAEAIAGELCFTFEMLANKKNKNWKECCKQGFDAMELTMQLDSMSNRTTSTH